jgi:hypothetical protein
LRLGGGGADKRKQESEQDGHDITSASVLCLRPSREALIAALRALDALT